MSAPRRSVKRIGRDAASRQAVRRQEHLSRQKEQRQQMLQALRQLGSEKEDHDDRLGDQQCIHHQDDQQGIHHQGDQQCIHHHDDQHGIADQQGITQHSIHHQDDQQGITQQGITDQQGILHQQGTLIQEKSSQDGHQTRKRPSRPKQRVMLSDWMEEIPDDLYENWVLIPCPKGKRCTIVASHGKTICRDKSGKIIDVFPSRLPNGSGKTFRGKGLQYSVLDAIYDENQGVFYILDIMAWHGQPTYEGEVDFRNFWLTSKMTEHDCDKRDESMQPKPFIPLKTMPCGPDLMVAVHDFSSAFVAASAAPASLVDMDISQDQSLSSRALVARYTWTFSLERQLDGYFFYDRRSHYVLGNNPCCAWLNPSKFTQLFPALEGAMDTGE